MRPAALRLFGLLIPVLILAACEGSTSQVEEHSDADSCVGCHTDYELLKEIHTPDSVIPDGGCSGPPPYIEPYDRVYLEPAGFASFQASTHGQLECIECHGGVGDTGDKATAHSGSFVRHPSFENIDACAACHDEVDNFKTGLHFTQRGQANSQITRAGADSWEELHPGIQEGYDKNCTTCHASCGSCHVNRPPAGGGGLLNGHAFQAPDMRDNCTQCHSSRGGHAYYGVAPGTQPDVHLTKADFECLDCHTTGEMHASTGAIYQHRYQVDEKPECTNCHTDIDGANAYHVRHIDDFNCQTCHSQDYNTCGSCHVGGEGARLHAHQEFKIGLNPLPEKPYKFTTLRRTLAAPDSWSVYGYAELTHFNDKPLYNYTSPHNIQRWTSRTQVEDGQSCRSACHIGDNGENSEWFLFSSDLAEGWERDAAASVVVDGHLPSRWGLN